MMFIRYNKPFTRNLIKHTLCVRKSIVVFWRLANQLLCVVGPDSLCSEVHRARPVKFLSCPFQRQFVFFCMPHSLSMLHSLRTVCSSSDLRVVALDPRSSSSQPIQLAGLYRCWFVYMREKYCWLVQMNSVFVRWLASPAPASQPSDRADPGLRFHNLGVKICDVEFDAIYSGVK